jgi:hypothetical protein
MNENGIEEDEDILISNISEQFSQTSLHHERLKSSHFYTLLPLTSTPKSEREEKLAWIIKPRICKHRFMGTSKDSPAKCRFSRSTKQDNRAN